MAKIEDRVAELMSKHPHLSEEDALKIVKDKNARKSQRRAEKKERIDAKREKYAAARAEKGEE